MTKKNSRTATQKNALIPGESVTQRSRRLGKAIVTAASPITVVVNKDDVATATKRDPAGCAVAVACKRQIPGLVAAHVGRSRTFLEDNKKIIHFENPRAMIDEVKIFDRVKQMALGAYTLRVPTPATTAAAQRVKWAKRRDAEKKAAQKHISSSMKGKKPTGPEVKLEKGLKMDKEFKKANVRRRV